MSWIYYYLLPLIVAWKKRSSDLAVEVFLLFGTMLGVFLAIWCEPLISQSLSALIPKDFKSLTPWISAVGIAAAVLITVVIFKKVVEKIIDDDLENFQFPEKIVKFLVPLVIFLHTGLICALLFTALSLTPAVKYLPFVFQNESLCSATRYRILWNSFFIDRFSFQPVSVNQRRRAFDRFVPENPGTAKSISSPRPHKRKVN